MLRIKRCSIDFKTYDTCNNIKILQCMLQWSFPSSSSTSTSKPNPPPKITSNDLSKELVPTASKKLVNKFKEPEENITSITKYAHSFDSIPGPKILKDLYKFWSFVPLFGTQLTARAVHYILNSSNQFSVGKDSKLFRYLTREYGPVVRFYGLLGGDVVVLSRPDHAAIVLQNEERYLCKSCVDCIDAFRVDQNRYCGECANLNNMKSAGEKKTIYSAVDHSLSKLAIEDIDVIEKSCDEMVLRIRAIRNIQEEVPGSFWTEIIKWSLQIQSYVLFYKHVGLLKPKGMHPKSVLLLQSYEMATEAIRKCESGINLWKFMDTSAWRSLVENCDVLEGFIRTNVVNTKRNIDKQLIPAYTSNWSLGCTLLREKVDPAEAKTALLDYLLLETNTIAFSVAFILYYLAKYPRIQKKLHNEIATESEPLLATRVKSYPYLNAVIKECLRMKPPLTTLNRILSKDVQVHNYRIPKGTHVLLATHLNNYREEHFEDPQRFHPSRWMSIEAPPDDNLFLFSSLPFGHDRCSKNAQDLAKLQIGLLVSKIVRAFNIQYFYGDIDSTNNFLPLPTKPLKFTFEDRYL